MLSYSQRKKIIPYFLILPSLLLVLGILGYGIVGGGILSFFKLNVMFERSFVGFSNYKEVFSDSRFLNSLKTTVIFVSGSIFLCTLFSFLSALTLNSIKRFGSFFRSMSLIPYFVSGIATAIMWRFLFSTNAGLANWVLIQFNLPEISWLGQAGTSMLISILSSSWAIIPLSSLMILGGLQTIDIELYESASLDGASGFQSLFKITIPLIKPIVGICLVWISYASFSMFDIILALTGGGPFQATEVLSLYMYTKGFKALNFGQGSVVMIVILLLNILMSVIYLKLFVQERDS